MKPINRKVSITPLPCPQHRVLARHIPAHSQRLCRKLRAMAHSHMSQQRWTEAVAIGGTALETADILLHHDSLKPQATERYMRCAIELAYALRKSRHEPDLSALVALAQHRLAAHIEPAALARTVAPLNDIAFAPLAEVDTWMEMLLTLDSAPCQTHH